MVAGKQGIPETFGPSDRILSLAQHKTSKTVWATTPCGKLSWGDQEPMWPVSPWPPGASPSARIRRLARPKRDFSATEDHRRKEAEAEASFSSKTRRPSCRTSQYEHVVRLSTPKRRGRGAQEAGPPHTPQCESRCPVWHIRPGARTAGVTPRLLQLSAPKVTRADLRSGGESSESGVSSSSKRRPVSQRLVRLSLPRAKRSDVCRALGRPEEPIQTVARAATRATASPRVETLATPKKLSKDYVPPREPEWSRKDIRSSRASPDIII